jgi:hypothetical protein
LFTGRESQAVIYKYADEKGVPTFSDDMQKIPEQFRAQAVIVSGVVTDETAEQEQARLAAEALTRLEQQAAAPAKAEEPITRRLIRSGVAVGLFVALLFVAYHIDALREQAQVLSRIRTGLVVLLLVFLSVTHARDVIGLFGTVGETVANPVADLQEKSAQRGKKAAGAYKSMERALDQRAHDEAARVKEIEKKFDDAEQGK